MIIVMTMINYVDRGAISYAQEDIIKEFGFDNIAWGAILGYFGYGYMLGSLFGGITADKRTEVCMASGWNIMVAV